MLKILKLINKKTFTSKTWSLYFDSNLHFIVILNNKCVLAFVIKSSKNKSIIKLRNIYSLNVKTKDGVYSQFTINGLNVLRNILTI